MTLLRVRDFDGLLDHYAHETPDDVSMIPYYADLWPAAHALARHLCAIPDQLAGRRVLELGCGLGLPSIVAAKLGAQVLATDFHPDNEPLFRANAAANQVPGIAYQSLRWSDFTPGASYDWVIGSDLVYEKKELEALVLCATTACARGGTILLADPGREHLQSAARLICRRGFQETVHVIEDCFVVEFRQT